MAVPSIVGIPWRNLVQNATITVSVPWTYPAAGVPGATGSAQSGTATFTLTAATAPIQTDNLMEMLAAGVATGQITVA